MSHLLLKKPLLVLLFVLLLILAGVFTFRSLPTPKPQRPANLSASPTPSPTTLSPGAYEIKKNPDSTYDQLYRGTVLNVEEKAGMMNEVTFRPEEAGSSTQTVNIYVPTTPPKNDIKIYGRTFKEMFDKGLTQIHLRIRYDQNERMIEWEVVPE